MTTLNTNPNPQAYALGQVSRLKMQHDRQRSQQRQKSMLMRTLADVGIA